MVGVMLLYMSSYQHFFKQHHVPVLAYRVDARILIPQKHLQEKYCLHANRKRSAVLVSTRQARHPLQSRGIGIARAHSSQGADPFQTG